MRIKKKIFTAIIGWAVFSIVLWLQILPVLNKPQEYQGDFKVHYYAGKASLLGYNPYNNKDTSRISYGRAWKPFKFFPYTLFIYRVIAKIDFFNAYYLYLATKVILYLLLILLWRYAFFKDTNIILFLLFVSLSIFSEAVYLDFRAGNVNIIEQLFLWLGILFLFRKKTILSGIFIILSSSFKLLTAVFLTLFLIKGLVKYFFIFLIILVLMLSAVWFLSPLEAHQFLKTHLYACGCWFSNDCPGHIAPSSLNFFRAVYYDNGINFYILMTIFILFISGFVIQRNYKSLKEKNYLIYFLITIYCLILPRLKDYSLVILLPAAYFLPGYFYKKKKYVIVAFFIFLFFLLSPHPLFPLEYLNNFNHLNLISLILKPFPAGFQQIIKDYHILLSCYVLWASYIFIIFKERKKTDVIT